MSAGRQRGDIRAPATTVSLVLGSGGAHGCAHIGVIEELERQGFAIQAVAGSSMGALVVASSPPASCRPSPTGPAP